MKNCRVSYHYSSCWKSSVTPFKSIAPLETPWRSWILIAKQSAASQAWITGPNPELQGKTWASLTNDGHHDVTAFGVSFFLMTKTCFVAWGRGAETMLQPSDTSWSSQHFRYSWGIPIWKHQTQGAFFFWIFEDAGVCWLLAPCCSPRPPVSSNGITRQRGDKRDGEGLQWHWCAELPLTVASRTERMGKDDDLHITYASLRPYDYVYLLKWIRNDSMMEIWMMGCFDNQDIFETSDVKGLFCLRIIGSSQSSHDNHRLQLCTAPCLVIETLL